MKRIVLYPYDVTDIHVLQHMDMTVYLNKEDLRLFCVAPRGWGYEGEDAGAKIGIATKICVESDYNRLIKNADTLIITESFLPISETEIIHKIEDALLNGIEVIVLRKLSLSVHKLLFEKAHDNLNLKLYVGNKIRLNDDIDINDKTIEKVPAPIILVIGAGERCCKFDVQLELRRELRKRNYKITQIGSKNYSEFYGFHSFPDFMLSYGEDSESNKIIGFNKYILQLYKEENPDVIIIGVPGGAFPYDDFFHNEFGILNYYVSHAVMADYIIFNSLYVDNLQEYLNDVINQLYNKYDYEVDQIYVSNFALNYPVSKSDKELSYITCNTQFVIEKTTGTSTFTIFDKKSKEKSLNKLVSTLQEYAYISVL